MLAGKAGFSLYNLMAGYVTIVLTDQWDICCVRIANY